MNVSEKVLTDSLIQLLEVVESVERFINWAEAGEDLRDDLQMGISEAKEALGDPGCEGGTCQRS